MGAGWEVKESPSHGQGSRLFLNGFSTCHGRPFFETLITVTCGCRAGWNFREIRIHWGCGLYVVFGNQ